MPSKPLKILFLEDRALDVELMLHELEAAQYDVTWTRIDTKDEFVRQLDGKWDLVLADYAIPQFNAIEALKTMKDMAVDIPTIIVTGSVSEEVAVECMKLGASDYLLKDRLIRLGPAVNSVITQKKLQVDKQRTTETLKQSEARYRTIFENAAVSIWEEDFSEVKKLIDNAKISGVSDFRNFLDKHPEFLGLVKDKIIIRDVNNATLKIFGAKGKEEFIQSVDKIYAPTSNNILREIVVALANDQLLLEVETIFQSLMGEKLHILVTMSIPPGQNNYENVLVSMVDITDRKILEQRTRLHVQRLDALRSIDKAINASMDFNIIKDIILEQTKTQLNADAVNLMLLDSYSHTLEHAGSVGFRGDAHKNLRLRLGESQVGKAALNRDTILISDIKAEDDPFKKPTRLIGEDIRAYIATPLIAKGQVKGVLEVLNRKPTYPDNDWIDFFKTLAGQAALAIDNTTLFQNLQKSHIDLTLAYDHTLEGWARAMGLRDYETEDHSQRVTEITLALAQMFSIRGQDLILIRRGAILHDVGKMGIPDAILHKPGPLSDAEWAIMMKHPTYSFELLTPITYLRPAIEIPYRHHERWDGSGYPHGLKGEQIPLAARIFAIVDVYDALLSERPYRKAWPPDKVLNYLREQSGSHFDPKVVELFFQYLSKFRKES